MMKTTRHQYFVGISKTIIEVIHHWVYAEEGIRERRDWKYDTVGNPTSKDLCKICSKNNKR